jgi:hypothetical protein
MGDEEREHAERSGDEEREHTERFTDEEFAFLRHVRFGKLPEPVEPADLVETVDPDSQHEDPPQPPVRREWG